MFDFDIILDMDWLHKCYSTIDCRNRVVRFQFPNQLELEWEGYSSNPSGQIVSHLKANKMLSKGYLYHLVRVDDLEHEVPSIEYVSIVNDFQHVSWPQGDLLWEGMNRDISKLWRTAQISNRLRLNTLSLEVLPSRLRSRYPHLFSSWG